MREIEFRGKENSKWVYGSYSAIGMEAIAQNHWIFTKYREQCLANKETVGQYIGVKDKPAQKKKSKMFDGDIVKVTDDFDNEPTYHVIRYYDDKDCPAFDLDPLIPNCECNGISFCILSSHHHIEVVGNIHDNPELMEKVEGKI